MWVAPGNPGELGCGVDERVSQLIDLALAEDIGPGDVTSEYFVPADREGRAFLVAKSNGVVAGVEVGAEVFQAENRLTHRDTLTSASSDRGRHEALHRQG